MSNQEFEAAVNLLLEKAPEDWFELQVRYQCFDGAMKIKTYSKNEESQDWNSFNFGGFDLMDFFDNYRSVTHPKLDEPWSVLTLSVDKDLVVEVEYGYGDPNVLGG